jgi:hypothetical protein
MKLKKSQIIRARCNPSLKDDIERIAFIKQLDAADVIRMALFDYVQKFRNSDHASQN